MKYNFNKTEIVLYRSTQNLATPFQRKSIVPVHSSRYHGDFIWQAIQACFDKVNFKSEDQFKERAEQFAAANLY